MSLRRYKDYKNSSVTWLGDIPTEWHVKRIKHTTYLKGRVGWKGLTSDEYLDSGYAYLVTGTDFSKKFINWCECHYVEQARYEDDPFIQLRDGDLLITKDGTIGKLALISGLDRPACLNSGIFLIRPTSDYVTEYMYWVLQSEAFKVFCDLSSLGSTIQHLYQNVFEDFAFPVPSLQEQLSIAAFLDHETAKIDALIAEQEKLIALLAEKRQATNSHAVTKGLNPSAPMKDSGVAWLSEVPAHWGVSALSYLASIDTGSTPDRGEPRYWNGSIPWLKTGEINWAPIREAEEFITDAGHENSATKIARPGTLLMAMYGQGITRGRVALLEIEATYNQACAAIQFGHRITPEFGRYFFMAAYHHVRDAGNETSQMNLSAGLIAKIRLPVPPADEQKAVVCFLDSEITKLDLLVAESERVIALLKERRSALIAAAVTGQIDVRGAIPQAAIESREPIAA